MSAKMPSSIKIANYSLHKWEEPCISGEKGTGAIFFSGCSLKCCFCQNYPISHENKGEPITTERLIEIMKELESKGVHTIDFVNPTHFSHILIEALKKYKPSVPVVYNSSGYDSVETLEKLQGLVDVYLPDLKYAENDLALKFSHAPDYFDKARLAIDEMFRQRGPYKMDDNGMLTSGVIIRHLILPGHLENSKKIIDYVKEKFDFYTIFLVDDKNNIYTINSDDEAREKHEQQEIIDFPRHRYITIKDKNEIDKLLNVFGTEMTILHKLSKLTK